MPGLNLCEIDLVSCFRSNFIFHRKLSRVAKSVEVSGTEGGRTVIGIQEPDADNLLVRKMVSNRRIG